MDNEKPIFVQCEECSTAFNVVFNGETTVRCPRKGCGTYLYFSLEGQEQARGYDKQWGLQEGEAHPWAGEQAFDKDGVAVQEKTQLTETGLTEG